MNYGIGKLFFLALRRLRNSSQSANFAACVATRFEAAEKPKTHAEAGKKGRKLAERYFSRWARL